MWRVLEQILGLLGVVENCVAAPPAGLAVALQLRHHAVGVDGRNDEVSAPRITVKARANTVAATRGEHEMKRHANWVAPFQVAAVSGELAQPPRFENEGIRSAKLWHAYGKAGLHRVVGANVAAVLVAVDVRGVFSVGDSGVYRGAEGGAIVLEIIRGGKCVVALIFAAFVQIWDRWGYYGLPQGWAVPVVAAIRPARQS